MPDPGKFGIGREIEMKLNIPEVTPIPMKKIPALAGLAAGLIALKCPLCLLALAGITAGIGSLMPVIHGVYQVIIGGLGVLFIWFLCRAWKNRAIPGWVVILGSLGFVGLIVQLVTEVGSVIGFLSALILSVASVASFVMKSGTSEAPCPSCETRIQVSMKGGEKNGE